MSKFPQAHLAHGESRTLEMPYTCLIEERPARRTKSPTEGLGIHSWKASSEDEDR